MNTDFFALLDMNIDILLKFKSRILFFLQFLKINSKEGDPFPNLLEYNEGDQQD